jgi:hypothetical protein
LNNNNNDDNNNHRTNIEAYDIIFKDENVTSLKEITEST